MATNTGSTISNSKQPSRTAVDQVPDGDPMRLASSGLWCPPDGRRPPWRFVLIVDRKPQTSLVRTLGPGATVLVEPYEPRIRLRFDWPAPTQVQAVTAAVRSVEAAGLRVLRVDNDDWATLADVAHRVGRCRETVRLWAVGHSGPGGFPPPVNPRRDTTYFSWVEVLAWLREQAGWELPDEDPALVAANLAIQLRALLPRLSRPKAILDLLGQS